ASGAWKRGPRVRTAIRASTAQPAQGFGIKRPVASNMPSWRDGPPKNWMIAAGIAQTAKAQATSAVAPAWIVAAETLSTRGTRPRAKKPGWGKKKVGNANKKTSIAA